MKTFITSDIHFSHNNIMKFNPATRPYRDADHMNEEIIKRWNETVAGDDIVYILGDVAFCNAVKATAIVSRLNGRKILVKGNHDSKLVKDEAFVNCFEEVHSYHEITHNGVKVCLFHYPISEWNCCHRGAVHLHGHLHGAKSGLEQYRVKDVGIDATGNIVSVLDDIIKQALKGELRVHGYATTLTDLKGEAPY